MATFAPIVLGAIFVYGANKFLEHQIVATLTEELRAVLPT